MNIYSDAIEQLGIFTIVGGILAIVATVLAYVFIVDAIIKVDTEG